MRENLLNRASCRLLAKCLTLWMLSLHLLFTGSQSDKVASDNVRLGNCSPYRVNVPQLLLLLQDLMDHVDCDRTFTNSRGDALYVSGANVAYGKHARQAGLQQVGMALQCPTCLREIIGAEVIAGFDESPAIQGEAALQPSRVRNCTGHQEDVPDRAYLFFSCLIVAPNARVPGQSLLRDRRAPSECAGQSPDCPQCAGSGTATSSAPRSRDLTRTWTLDAVWERNTAACPAELPPPTTITSSLTHNCASMKVAP